MDAKFVFNEVAGYFFDASDLDVDECLEVLNWNEAHCYLCSERRLRRAHASTYNSRDTTGRLIKLLKNKRESEAAKRRAEQERERQARLTPSNIVDVYMMSDRDDVNCEFHVKFDQDHDRRVNYKLLSRAPAILKELREQVPDSPVLAAFDKDVLDK